VFFGQNIRESDRGLFGDNIPELSRGMKEATKHLLGYNKPEEIFEHRAPQYIYITATSGAF